MLHLRKYILPNAHCPNQLDMHEDVFLNFKDQQGDFIEADTRSLLSLYNMQHT